MEGHAVGAKLVVLGEVFGALGAKHRAAWGEHDPFFPLAQAERTVVAARHGRLAIYDGARHFLPDERPEQLASDLRQLIQDSTP
jgi:pimeloyl-ACP methyl ester carboxylesterase